MTWKIKQPTTYQEVEKRLQEIENKIDDGASIIDVTPIKKEIK